MQHNVMFLGLSRVRSKGADDINHAFLSSYIASHVSTTSIFMKKTAMHWLPATVLIIASSAAHAQQAPLPTASAAHTASWATLVNKDANLYRIDDKLYRSEQLTAEDAKTITNLGIKSVINLRYFSRNKNRTALLSPDLTLLNRPPLTWDIRPKQIAEILYVIEQQQQKGPVLVHCYHGADRTGLISGMYRIIVQGWSIDAAKTEMQQGPYGYHSVWKNIDKLFTEHTVQQVRQHLNSLRNQTVQAQQ